MTNKTSSRLMALLPSRRVIRISGPAARSFLQGVVTNDIEKATDAAAIYAALLTPQGKVLHDFFIAADGDALLLEVEADRAEDLLKRLRMYKLRAKVDIEDIGEDWAVAVLFGGESSGDRGAVLSREAGVAFVDPRLAALGARVLAPKDALASAAKALGATGETDARAFLAHRLALGVPEAPGEIRPEKAFPLECNMEELGAIDFHKGCYVGQEVTSRSKRRGNVRKRIVAVEFDRDAPEPGAIVTAGSSEIGEVLSGDGTQALALMRIDRWRKADAARVPLEADGAAATVIVPDYVRLPEEEPAS